MTLKSPNEVIDITSEKPKAKWGPNALVMRTGSGWPLSALQSPMMHRKHVKNEPANVENGLTYMSRFGSPVSAVCPTVSLISTATA